MLFLRFTHVYCLFLSSLQRRCAHFSYFLFEKQMISVRLVAQNSSFSAFGPVKSATSEKNHFKNAKKPLAEPMGSPRRSFSATARCKDVRCSSSSGFFCRRTAKSKTIRPPGPHRTAHTPVQTSGSPRMPAGTGPEHRPSRRAKGRLVFFPEGRRLPVGFAQALLRQRPVAGDMHRQNRLTRLHPPGPACVLFHDHIFKLQRSQPEQAAAHLPPRPLFPVKQRPARALAHLLYEPGKAGGRVPENFFRHADLRSFFTGKAGGP